MLCTASGIAGGSRCPAVHVSRRLRVQAASGVAPGSRTSHEKSSSRCLLFHPPVEHCRAQQQKRHLARKRKPWMALAALGMRAQPPQPPAVSPDLGRPAVAAAARTAAVHDAVASLGWILSALVVLTRLAQQLSSHAQPQQASHAAWGELGAVGASSVPLGYGGIPLGGWRDLAGPEAAPHSLGRQLGKMRGGRVWSEPVASGPGACGCGPLQWLLS